MAGQKKTIYVSDDNLKKVEQIRGLSPDITSIPQLLSEMIEMFRLMRLCGIKTIKPAAWVAIELGEFENLNTTYDDDGQKVLSVKPGLMQLKPTEECSEEEKRMGYDKEPKYVDYVRRLLSSKKGLPK